MNIYVKTAVVAFVAILQLPLVHSSSHAETICGREMLMMHEIRKRFSDPKGEFHYAIARGVNRKVAIWKACGFKRNGKSASAAKNHALKDCRKFSDACKIVAYFRWTQKKCPTRSCFVRVPR